MKEVVASGRTVEDAKTEALRELGVKSEEDVEIEVIDEGSKGVFGWGTKFARVKVKLIRESEEEAVEEKKVEKKTESKPAKQSQRKPAPRMKDSEKPPRREEKKEFEPEVAREVGRKSLEPSPRAEDIDEPIRLKTDIPPITVGERPLPEVTAESDRTEKKEPRREKKTREHREVKPPQKDYDDYIDSYEDEDDQEDQEEYNEEELELLEDEEGTGPYAPRDIIKQLMEYMGTAGDISLVKGSSGPVYMIRGEDLGILIGKHGQTLEALQFIVNLILMRRTDRKKKITIDVEGYRSRREKSLRDLARRLADKARRDRRNVVLEPMLPSERRIIHLSLQNNNSVFTFSQGEEPMRRVVISPRKKRTDRGEGSDRSDRGEKNSRNERYARSDRR